MSAHSLPISQDRVYRNGFNRVSDPGASSTISYHNIGNAVCVVVTATAESRALPSAAAYGIGSQLLVILKTAGGALTITGGTDGSTILDAAGDIAAFVVSDVNGTNGWKNTTFDVDVDTLEANLALANSGIRSGTVTTLTETATVTPAQTLSGLITATPVSAATYTFPTAADLVAAIPNAAVGQIFRLAIHNNGADADAITIAAGSGGTDEGVLTIAQDATRDIIFQLTNVTASSEAYLLYGIT